MTSLKTFAQQYLKNSLKAINFAKEVLTITNEEIEMIFQCRHAILLNKLNPWIRRGTKEVNVTMRAWDFAEICKFVGLYLLLQLNNLDARVSVGLYRNDGSVHLCSHLGKQKSSPKNSASVKPNDKPNYIHQE